MHQAMKNVRHFIQSVGIMLRALAIAGKGAERRMALAAIVSAITIGFTKPSPPLVMAGLPPSLRLRRTDT